jgi:Mn-dependent DtxR family transcriptional regulator
LNIAKSVLEPVQSLVFLGMIIDTENKSFFLTEKTKEKLKNVRQMILQCFRYSNNEINSLINGYFSWCGRIVFLGW